MGQLQVELGLLGSHGVLGGHGAGGLGGLSVGNAGSESLSQLLPAAGQFGGGRTKGFQQPGALSGEVVDHTKGLDLKVEHGWGRGLWGPALER